MAEHPYDSDQLKAVNANGNVVVAAGAGSGKTTVLAGRYLRLVREGVTVPSILTLTFTRKAAAEMHVRIHRLLTEHADEAVVREQLALFDQARISTLDSFCSRLARNDAPRFGLPFSFSVDQEGLQRRAESFALQFMLDKRQHPALKTLIAANGFETVWKEFFASYAVREIRIADPPDHGADFGRQTEYCRVQTGEIFSRLDELYSRMGSVAGEASGSSKTLTEAGKIAEEWTDPSGLIDRGSWDELFDLACRKLPRKPGSNVKNPDLIILRDLIEEMRLLQEQAVSLTAVLCNREVYKGIAELMDEFAAGWNNLKRSQGLVSFGDVVSMAVMLLKESRELRSYYKAQFSHIMIDEFQDNNELQKELLYLLAEKQDRFSPGIPAPEDLDEGKLFFVGDEKQSIYRFRGADVSVFKRLSRELGRDGIELGTNYRSNPGLISFFNRFFPPVFSSSEELQDFEAAFRPLTGRKTGPGEGDPEIRLLYLDEPGEEADGGEYLSAVESEAFEAARLIQDAVAGRGLQLPDASGTRTPDYDDFALLLRSTGNQIIYERIFRRFGIPYITENIRTLFLEAPVNDIYAALQCCIYPEDRMAYAVYLRSFFVNLSDESLLAELLDENLPFEGEPERFAPAEAEKYRLGGEIYRRLSEMIDRVPHRDVFRFLWYEAGYRYNLLIDPAWHGYLELYEYLLALADKSWDAGESMAIFLDFLRENLGEYKKLEEIDILRTREQGVRIMTIHKSKGLEFPIVLLGSAGQCSNERGKRAAYFVDSEFGLTVNMAVPGSQVQGKRLKPNPFYERGLELSRQMEAAEMKRLLYVACTRAEQHLVMLGCSPKKKCTNMPSLLDLIFTGLDCSAEDPDSPYVRLFSLVPRKELYRRAVNAPGAERRRERLAEYHHLSENPPFEMPAFQPVLSVSRLNEAAAALFSGNEGVELGPLKVDPLIRDREELFGTVVHRIIEGMITGKTSSDTDSLLPGFTEGEAGDLLACADELARSFWSSSFRRELIPDGVPCYSEVPFTLGIESGGSRYLVEGVIDLYADLGDRLVCIDFKTNRWRIPGEYAIQMWCYRKALETLCKKPVSSYLYYLRENQPREELFDFDPGKLDELISAAARKL